MNKQTITFRLERDSEFEYISVDEVYNSPETKPKKKTLHI